VEYWINGPATDGIHDKIKITNDTGNDSQVKYVANPYDVYIRKVYPDG
jgi:hypothetical protein